jgi:hypothetical protein
MLEIEYFSLSKLITEIPQKTKSLVQIEILNT